MTGNLIQLPGATAGNTGWPWTEEVDPKVYNTNVNYPKISIVTPSYNQGQFIEETIRSILLQNYPNLEYIIIDGGSTDNTIQVIKKYEKFITYWVSEKDKGQSHAINKGMEKCTGKWFNWVNSDDYLLKGAFYQLINASVIKNEQLSIVSGNIQVLNLSGRIESIKPVSEDDIDYKYIAGVAFHQPAALFNLTHINKIGGLDEDIHYTMCLEMMAKINLVGEYERVDADIVVARMHEGSKTVSATDKFYTDRINTYSKLFKHFPISCRNENLIRVLADVTGYDFAYSENSFKPARFSKEMIENAQLYIASIIARLYYQHNENEKSFRILKFIKKQHSDYYKNNRQLRSLNVKLSSPFSFLRKIKNALK